VAAADARCYRPDQYRLKDPTATAPDSDRRAGVQEEIWVCASEELAVCLASPHSSPDVEQMICHAQDAWISGCIDDDIHGSLKDRIVVLEQIGQDRL
jgi:hypothetical protein